MELKIQQRGKRFVLRLEDAFDNTVAIKGIPTWEISDEKVAKLVVSENGTQAEVVSLTRAGSASVKCVGKDENDQTFLASALVNVHPGAAVEMVILEEGEAKDTAENPAPPTQPAQPPIVTEPSPPAPTEPATHTEAFESSKAKAIK